MLKDIKYQEETVSIAVKKDSILHQYAKRDKMEIREFKLAEFELKEKAVHELYRKCTMECVRNDIWNLDDFYIEIDENAYRGDKNSIVLNITFSTKSIVSYIKVRGILRLHNNFYNKDRNVLKDIIKASSFEGVAVRYLEDEFKKYCMINNLDRNNYESSGGLYIGSYEGSEIYGESSAYEGGQNLIYETTYYHVDYEEDKQSGSNDWHTFYL